MFLHVYLYALQCEIIIVVGVVISVNVNRVFDWHTYSKYERIVSKTNNIKSPSPTTFYSNARLGSSLFQWCSLSLSRSLFIFFFHLKWFFFRFRCNAISEHSCFLVVDKFMVYRCYQCQQRAYPKNKKWEL